MALFWTLKSQHDLRRIWQFSAQQSEDYATKLIEQLTAAVALMAEQPASGRLQPFYKPREVRCWMVNNYVIHYEVQADNLYILDLWHQREARTPG